MSDFTTRSQPAEPDAPRVPSLTERITEILREHFPEYISGSCLCGAEFDKYIEYNDHVAPLIAAAAEQHYRRRIETVEQLDTLPEDSVVRDDSRYVYEKATARRWHQPGWEGQRWSDAIDLPATVLWSPGGERSAAETRTLTCDAGCLDEGAPMEECSAHGRTPADLWLQLDLVRKQRNEARAKVERLRGALDGLKTEWENAAEEEGGELGGPTAGAFYECAASIEAVLRGDQ